MTSGDVLDGARDPRVVGPALQPRNDLLVAHRRLHEAQQLWRQTRRDRRRLGVAPALPSLGGDIGRASEVGEGAAHNGAPMLPQSSAAGNGCPKGCAVAFAT